MIVDVADHVVDTRSIAVIGPVYTTKIFSFSPIHGNQCRLIFRFAITIAGKGDLLADNTTEDGASEARTRIIDAWKKDYHA